MKVDYTKQFLKQFKKLRPTEKQRFLKRLELWRQNPQAKLLNTHRLVGKYQGAYSINVGGDLRAIYRQVGQNTVWFDFIGTHSQLYGK